MINKFMKLYEGHFDTLEAVVSDLVKNARARTVFLIDKNGQLIAAAGELDEVDATSLASLTAGYIAAAAGIAKALEESEFAAQCHEGESANVHIQLVGNRRGILVVVFDGATSLGLVRLRVQRTRDQLLEVFEAVDRRQAEQQCGKLSQKTVITDEELERLFLE